MDRTDAERSVLRLEELLAAYVKDSDALFRKESGVKNSLKSILGGQNDVKTDPIHVEFFKAVEGTVAELAGQLSAEPDAACAARGMRALLSEKTKGDNLVQYWWLVAAEPLALPLVPFVEPEELRLLWESYGRRYPKRERLPRQQELYAAMAKRLGISKRQWK